MDKNRLEQIQKANQFLLDDQPEYKKESTAFPQDIINQRRLMRSLMNVRRPRLKLKPEYIRLQDAILAAEREEKGIVHVNELPRVDLNFRISLWRGDITRLDADAIVNAANSEMLGCFIPGHNCIDNVIHSAAGLQLREACAEIMQKQGHSEPTGQAKITSGYNLPAKYVIHTVGPIISGEVTEQDRQLLASSYLSCLTLAEMNHLKNIAFCCISTGVFHFPKQEAAEIAVKTVQEFLTTQTSIEQVIFNVHSEQNEQIYRGLLGGDREV